MLKIFKYLIETDIKPFFSQFKQQLSQTQLLITPLVKLLAQVFNKVIRANKISISKYNYSIYFLKGSDHRKLDHSQQLEISEFVDAKPMSNSFMVYNSHQANRKLQNWFTNFPWIRPYYAIKSNPISLICKQLAEGGAGMDCASKVEIQQALNIGLSPSEIVYSNPVKDENDLKWAADNNIKLTTADTIDQLLKIKKLAPQMEVLWRITIKEDANDNISTTFSGKFGDDLDTQESIHDRMKEIKKLGIKLNGIHFHCGSGLDGSSGFNKAINLARSCIQIGRKYNHRMEIMDIGGGFPSGDLSQSTIKALQMTKNDPLGYRIMAEPGRHFSSKTFYLLTRIIGKRIKSGMPCYHLNESVYHNFNCTIMDDVNFDGSNDQFYGKVENQTNTFFDQMQNAKLLGMTCDGRDVITKSMSVPIQMKVGDWLCFSGMGSYTYGSRTTFNGMSSAEIIDYWSGDVNKKEQLQDIPIFI